MFCHQKCNEFTFDILTSEHPPHCHFRGFLRMLLSHEHSAKSPFEQALVTDHARAAEFIACIYAVSLLSDENVKNLDCISQRNLNKITYCQYIAIDNIRNRRTIPTIISKMMLTFLFTDFGTQRNGLE